MIDFTFFDFKKYLDSRGVKYDTSGKNISQRGNWIGMKCLWCQDHSNHLGINLDTKGFNCWICSAKGKAPFSLIMRLDNCSYYRAEKTVQEFSSMRVLLDQRTLTTSEVPQSIIEVLNAERAEKKLLYLHRNFLESRNFDPDYIFDKYKLFCCGAGSRWCHRLIVPFYQNNRIVTFTARDVTDKAKVSYDHLPNYESIVPVKETLYNIESIKDTAVVVEGVTDVWRIGDGACAVMGYKYTAHQVYSLSNVRRIFILFDTEEKAQKLAEEFAFELSTMVPSVEVLQLESGDPGDLSEDDANNLRREIFGKIY
jgi:DNA primase